jgi:hypothetical protein
MTETVPTPEQENKKPAKKLHQIGQKIKHWFQQAHKKIGVYGWISVGLFLLLVGTIAHYEGRDFRRYHDWSMPRPMYIHKQSDWMRDIDRDFENMHRQMDMMRARHERMMRDAWSLPMNIENASTSSFVSNGNFQYSLNTNNGKLDGFISASPEEIAKLLPQVQKLGLTVEQKDNRLFISGEAKAMNELLKLLR